jgi:centrin-3
MSVDPIQVFKFLDKNNKNKINKEDLFLAIRYLGIIKPKNEINYLIQKLPNELSLEEYSKIIEEQKQTSLTKENLISAFEIFDEEKTGKCSSKELFHALSVIGEKLSENDIEDIKSKIKIEKNGLIDYKQFIDIFLN